MKKYMGDDIEPEDVVSEPEADEAGEEKAEAKVAKMREELAALRREKQEYMDGWQRSRADYVNLLKRIEADAKASESKGKMAAIETLLPAFDALERAKEHGELPEGFAAIVRQLESAFTTLGLEPVGTVGEPFDPNFHEALGQDPVAQVDKDDTINSVLERGWRVGTTVIRPAKVRVGHFEKT